MPGLDLAGTVVAIGPDVTRFAVGDEVYGFGKGAFAEYALAPRGQARPQAGDPLLRAGGRGPGLGRHRAAGARTSATCRPGQKVLVIGASGGVGSYAVQLAKAFGAEVTGVASTAKLDLVRASAPTTSSTTRARTSPTARRRYDLILDIGGNPVGRAAAVGRSRPPAPWCIVGGEEGAA